MEPRTVLALTVVLLLAVGFAVQHFWSGKPSGVAAPEAPAAGRPSKSAPGSAGSPGGRPPGKKVVVDIAGKVRKPGVRRLPSGSRVEDALAAAGGAKRGTSLQGLNRARVLADGEQLVVGGAPAAGSGPAAGTGSGAAATSGEGAAGGRVSLNSATAEQLESLPGVGPVLARQIVEHRDQHGGFSSVDDLRQVKGIGDGRFSDLKSQVSP